MLFSASTVTLIFCGERSLPTSNSNVCLVGELPYICCDLRTLDCRIDFEGDEKVGVSLRGSGEEDKMSAML